MGLYLFNLWFNEYIIPFNDTRGENISTGKLQNAFLKAIHKS